MAFGQNECTLRWVLDMKDIQLVKFSNPNSNLTQMNTKKDSKSIAPVFYPYVQKPYRYTPFCPKLIHIYPFLSIVLCFLLDIRCDVQSMAQY